MAILMPGPAAYNLPGSRTGGGPKNICPEPSCQRSPRSCPNISVRSSVRATSVSAARGLGVIEPVTADFYKLLIYDAGSFFVDHRDTEKVPGMFATLVIVLPSAHSGGELVVRHLGREVTLDLRPDDPAELGFAAFYADCVHEVRPVATGYRLTLVYNLRFSGKRRRLEAPGYRAEKARVSDLLRGWTRSASVWWRRPIARRISWRSCP